MPRRESTAAEVFVERIGIATHFMTVKGFIHRIAVKERRIAREPMAVVGRARAVYSTMTQVS